MIANHFEGKGNRAGHSVCTVADADGGVALTGVANGNDGDTVATASVYDSGKRV